MPTPNELKAPFYSDCFYHIVCKSIDGLLLFNDEQDYQVFLHRFKKFTGDFLDVWSYCLLSNHTHHVVKIKSTEAIKSFINQLESGNKTKAMQKWLHAIVPGESPPKGDSPGVGHPTGLLFDAMLERQMNSFLVSYANYLNNKYNRKGGLFQKPFKRKQIHDNGYLHQAIVYTNANAQKHQLVKDFRQYCFSSFNSIRNNDQYFIDSKNILLFFGGVEKFVKIHEEQVAYFYGKGWPSSKLE